MNTLFTQHRRILKSRAAGLVIIALLGFFSLGVRADSQEALRDFATGLTKYVQSVSSGQSGGAKPESILTHSDLTNGSRMIVQTYLLKTLLAVIDEPGENQVQALDEAIGDVETFLAKPETRFQLTNAADAEAFRQSLRSPYHRLDDDLLMEDHLRSLVPIRLVVSAKNHNLLEKLDADFRVLDVHFLQDLRLSLFDVLADRGVVGQWARHTLLKTSPPLKLALLQRVQDELNKQLKTISNVADQVAGSDAINFKRQADQRFFTLLITTYFGDISRDQAKNVVKSVIERPDQRAPTDIFRQLVLNAGPQMQKLLQIFGREAGFDPEIQKVFHELEESGAPVPLARLKADLEEPPQGYTWESISPKPFVGTMAQVHPAVVRNKSTGTSLKIAARVLKPEIEKQLDREQLKLEKLAAVLDGDPVLRAANFPLMAPVLDDIRAMAADEIDIALSKRNQELGDQRYSRDIVTPGGVRLHVRVPLVLASTNLRAMYSEWIEGEKFADYQKENPKAATEVAQAIAKIWIDVALFDGRVFHSDLHQGNIKFRSLGPNEVEVRLLDFGMFGTLATAQRSLLLRLAIASMAKARPSVLSAYIWQLSDAAENRLTPEQLAAKVSEHQAQLKLENQKAEMADWLMWAMSEGMKMDRQITSFSRGVSAIDQLLLAADSTKNSGYYFEQVAKENKGPVVAAAARFGVDSARSLTQDHVEKVVTGTRSLMCRVVAQ